ncbi:MAG: uracil-DNA glycosylase [Chloroherpetonaceae bacterium]|nr:uracil-DNA glycosylase [Chthonomonadaceae bacterium]MDW8208199.1 uracil-DNA glycosylase [Chloroherpetonaceae bacterium]
MRELPEGWCTVLAEELHKPYFRDLVAFLQAERQQHTVYPPENEVFAALEVTPYARVAAVILGQDPYHGPGQAHGLSFSVRPGVRPPPSLKNILKELHADLGVPVPEHGCLTRWAEQGVLLLNTVLTVRAGEPLSHRGRGWETFTDAIIWQLNARPDPVVFVLWGAPAQQKTRIIDATRHPVITAPHPSPLSARSGFFGSRPFSRVNTALRALGRAEIDWRLPPV